MASVHDIGKRQVVVNVAWLRKRALVAGLHSSIHDPCGNITVPKRYLGYTSSPFFPSVCWPETGRFHRSLLHLSLSVSEGLTDFIILTITRIFKSIGVLSAIRILVLEMMWSRRVHNRTESGGEKRLFNKYCMPRQMSRQDSFCVPKKKKKKK